jgi:hypothetical protein
MAPSGILSGTTAIANAVDNYVADREKTPGHAFSDQASSDNDHTTLLPMSVFCRPLDCVLGLPQQGFGLSNSKQSS